ncbi:MAG: FtsX-like permease family protein [Candidatus Heimdallarchaeota archaeon]|nr:FtsX-like permease family protein [Candidatus Heimdallarchaeota archaeon]MCK5047877.1 FtsX-like permease family protein [Candidatus Heimdallarchaeota archaeon]
MAFAISYAFKSISRRKQKNMTAILAIALGVALFVGVQIGNTGLKRIVVQGVYGSIGNTDITISSDRDSYIPENITLDIMGIESYDQIVIEPRIEFFSTGYASGEIESDIRVTGYDPNLPDSDYFGSFDDLIGTEITASSILLPISGGDDPRPVVNALISEEMKDNLNLVTDDTIRLSFDMGNGTFTDIEIKAVAFYDDTKDRGLDGTNVFQPTSHVYVHIDELQQRLMPSLQDHISSFAITLKTGVDRKISSVDLNTADFPGSSKIEAIADELNVVVDSLNISGLRVYSLRVEIASAALAGIIEIGGVLNLFVFILLTIALLLIINVQMMAVEDRKNQIAILRALGSDRRKIFTIFLIEASVVGIFGGIVGVLFGIPLSIMIVTLIGDVFGIPPAELVIENSVIFQAAFMGLILSIITALAPAIKSTGKSIANALRGIEEPKKPRKGYVVAIIGLIFLVFGLISAINTGKFWAKEGWSTFEDVQNILLGLGMTLAGAGMLLTLIINRKIALNISAIALWGLASFVLLIAIGWIEAGDPNQIMTILMFYTITGATMLISVNYEFLLRSIGRLLSIFPKLRGISQVTTRGMIGRKTRGVLVFTIFSIILTMNVMILSTAESIRIGLVEDFEWRADGIDVVVDARLPLEGIQEKIESLDTVTTVFGFRRAMVPYDTLDTTLPGVEYDETGASGWMPVIEVPESVINSNNNWDSDSYRVSLTSVLSGDENGAIADKPVAVTYEESDFDDLSAEIFEGFYANKTRTTIREYVLNEGEHELNMDVLETQQMVIGGQFVMYMDLNLVMGASLYMKDHSGSAIKMYIGATAFDLMGLDDLFGIGLLVTPGIAQSLPQFDNILNPNLFLVRSSNGYDAEEENDVLASLIETSINDLDDPTSLSSLAGVLIGASTRLVYEEVIYYTHQQAAFWDFLAVFMSIGLVIGIMGMSIIAIRSVSERLREIGMMRSIGFSRISVVQGVIIEMVILSFIGILIGVINGILFTIAIARNLFVTSDYYPVPVLIAYIVGVMLISIIAAVIPAYRASRISPSQALRYTG